MLRCAISGHFLNLLNVENFLQKNIVMKFPALHQWSGFSDAKRNLKILIIMDFFYLFPCRSSVLFKVNWTLQWETWITISSV